MQYFHAALTALALAALIIPWPIDAAAAQCDGGRFVRAYESGLDSFKAGDFAAAAAAWGPLADAGFVPAQSQLGRMYATGSGLGANPARAFVLLGLASREGELRARQALADLDKKITPEQRRAALSSVENWELRLDDCLRASLGDVDGRVVDAENSVITYRGVSILLSDDKYNKGIKNIIDSSINISPVNLIYLKYLKSIIVRDFIDGIIIAVSGGDVHMAISDKYALHDDPSEVASAVLRRARQMLYARSPGVVFADPLDRLYLGVSLRGSEYLDADNAPFFEQISMALDLAKGLSPELRGYVGLITRIIYDPPSKFKRSNPSGNAYYLPSGDPEKERVVLIPKNLKLSGAPAVLARSLVHEGTHAAQHLRSFRMRAEVAEARARLDRVSRDGAGVECGECARLRAWVSAMEDEIAMWSDPQKRHGPAFVQMFECEAALNGLAAVEQLGLGRSAGNPYASVCEEVEKRRWSLPDDRMGVTPP